MHYFNAIQLEAILYDLLHLQTTQFQFHQKMKRRPVMTKLK